MIKSVAYLKTIIWAIFFFVASAFATQSVNAQDLGYNKDDSKAVVLARELGTLGGAAIWCKFDETFIEEFLAWSETQITLVAEDDFDRVSARIRLGDTRMIAAGKQPKVDCKTIEREIMQKQANSRL